MHSAGPLPLPRIRAGHTQPDPAPDLLWRVPLTQRNQSGGGFSLSSAATASARATQAASCSTSGGSASAS